MTSRELNTSDSQAPDTHHASLSRALIGPVIGYGLVGFLWMFPTGWILGHYQTLEAWLLTWHATEHEAVRMAMTLWIGAMVSLLLFFTYFRFTYPLGRSTGAGLGSAIVFSIGLFAAFIGYGPGRFLAELMAGR